MTITMFSIIILNTMGVNDIFILSVMTVRNVNFKTELSQNAKIREVNDLLKDGCTRESFDFISNDNIGKDMLWNDGIHLVDQGRDILVDNIVGSVSQKFSGAHYEET